MQSHVPSPLASEYVTGIEGCGRVSNIEQPELAEWFGWLRDNVRDSLRVCLNMRCGDGRAQCTNEWMATVFP
ncbi:MAG: hypothetical protein AAF938_03505 [Myxococcota bacterium]